MSEMDNGKREWQGGREKWGSATRAGVSITMQVRSSSIEWQRSNADRMSVLLMLRETPAKWKLPWEACGWLSAFWATPSVNTADNLLISGGGIVTYVYRVRRFASQSLWLSFKKYKEETKDRSWSVRDVEPGGGWGATQNLSKWKKKLVNVFGGRWNGINHLRWSLCGHVYETQRKRQERDGLVYRLASKKTAFVHRVIFKSSSEARIPPCAFLSNHGDKWNLTVFQQTQCRKDYHVPNKLSLSDEETGWTNF